MLACRDLMFHILWHHVIQSERYQSMFYPFLGIECNTPEKTYHFREHDMIPLTQHRPCIVSVRHASLNVFSLSVEGDHVSGIKIPRKGLVKVFSNHISKTLCMILWKMVYMVWYYVFTLNKKEPDSFWLWKAVITKAQPGIGGVHHERPGWRKYRRWYP